MIAQSLRISTKGIYISLQRSRDEVKVVIQSIKHWSGSSLEDPKISVLIPCWHGEESIFGALDSVEAQIDLPSALAVEIVVVADGRKEDGQAVEEWIQSRGESTRCDLTLLQLERNVGAGASRRLGYAHCKGEFLAFLDDDDLWHPRKLALQWQWHDENQDRIASVHGYGVQQAERETSFARLLLGGFPMATPTLMIRRSLWPYSPEPYRYGEDFLTLAMIARLQPIKVLGNNLAWRSKAVPPVFADPYSLSRQRLKLRAGKLRAIGLLVERGYLSPIWMPLILLWEIVLTLRRFVLDWAAGFLEPAA